MFGPFKPTSPLSGGLLWKIPYRLSAPQKRRQRKRLRAVDTVVAVVDAALQRQRQRLQSLHISASGTAPGNENKVVSVRKEGGAGTTLKQLERWKAEMPTEAEMQPRDKYSMFDRKEKSYRKGVHKLPKWTRVSQRINPPGF